MVSNKIIKTKSKNKKTKEVAMTNLSMKKSHQFQVISHLLVLFSKISLE